MLLQQAGQVVRSPAAAALFQQICAGGSFGAQQLRFIGGDKVPEFWGQPSSYTEGTGFLGTPKDHMKLTHKRPLSPDVLEIDNKSPHYKFPLGAISSIINRVTGAALSVGFAGAGYLSLTGSLPGVVKTISGSFLLGFPLKLLVSYTIIYHFLGGLRHIVWDHNKIGKQQDKTSLLEVPQVELSSKILLGSSAVLALICALL